MALEHLIRRSDNSVDQSNDTCKYYYKNLPSGSTVLSSSVTRVVSVNNSGFVGWDVPDFHKRRRRGDLLPMTPWYQFSEVGSVSGSINVVSKDLATPPKKQAYWSVGNHCPYVWSLSETEIEDYCPDQYTHQAYMAEAAAKIYANGHDTLTFMAELADTKRLFVQTGKKLLRLQFPRNWKSLSSEWLAARYGWRTLIYDLHDLNKAVANLGVRRSRYSERAGSTTKRSYPVGESFTSSLGIVSATQVDKVTTGIRGSVVADISVPQFQFNPLQTGWELIPFSFVVDWFLNVGRTIAAWSFLTLNTGYVASSGYAVDIVRDYEWELTETNQYYDSGTNSGTAQHTVRVERRIPGRIPYLPRFILKLNYAKVMDLVALIIQRTR